MRTELTTLKSRQIHPRKASIDDNGLTAAIKAQHSNFLPHFLSESLYVFQPKTESLFQIG